MEILKYLKRGTSNSNLARVYGDIGDLYYFYILAPTHDAIQALLGLRREFNGLMGTFHLTDRDIAAIDTKDMTETEANLYGDQHQETIAFKVTLTDDNVICKVINKANNGDELEHRDLQILEDLENFINHDPDPANKSDVYVGDNLANDVNYWRYGE